MGKGYIFVCSKCIKKDDPIECSEEEDHINGTFFDIKIGGLMKLFCKKQLEEIYETSGTATNDENIDKVIYDNIKNGFNFTEILGHLPYYCETCEKLCSHFYFQMEKENELYVPNYICPKCKNTLELASLTWENKGGWGWSQDPKKINFKYNLYVNDGIIQIKSHNKKKRLSCDYCNNEVFELFSITCWD